jgi:hypothetical protein
MIQIQDNSRMNIIQIYIYIYIYIILNVFSVDIITI